MELRRLRRANPKTGDRRSLRDIAAALAKAGHISSTGRPYSAKSVRAMLAQRLPGEAIPASEVLSGRRPEWSASGNLRLRWQRKVP
jgi:hypothetical protein